MVLREFRLPDLGEGLTESDIVAWKVATGDRVKLNQIIAEVETAKALVELPSPFEGIVARLHAEAGQTVNVGEPLVTFEVAGGDDSPTPSVPATTVQQAADDGPEPNLVGYGARPDRAGRPARRSRTVVVAAAEPPGASTGERPRSTPPVRRLAQQLGVVLDTVTGTGEGGLVTREDVEAAATSVVPEAGVPTPRERGARETRTPIKGVRKHTAQAMVSSAFTAPHVSEFLTIDVTPTMELLDRLQTSRLAEGVRITVLALVARAVCIVLERHPSLNSSWDETSQEIVQYGYVNLGIAAATDRGLVVPNIKDADGLPLLDLARELGALVDDARAGRLTTRQLTGGTITITNIGVFGIDAGTPILNPGEAAILALGAVQRRPWEYEGEVALRQLMTLSLSFDHRLVDGEQGSRFLAELGALLADPALALLLTR
jgi:pyruvate dehydrogenase E2 component (dihydrolipoamide acetyltransferase)